MQSHASSYSHRTIRSDGQRCDFIVRLKCTQRNHKIAWKPIRTSVDITLGVWSHSQATWRDHFQRMLKLIETAPEVCLRLCEPVNLNKCVFCYFTFKNRNVPKPLQSLRQISERVSKIQYPDRGHYPLQNLELQNHQYSARHSLLCFGPSFAYILWTPKNIILISFWYLTWITQRAFIIFVLLR